MVHGQGGVQSGRIPTGCVGDGIRWHTDGHRGGTLLGHTQHGDWWLVAEVSNLMETI